MSVRSKTNARVDRKVFRHTANRSKMLPGRVVRNKRGGQVF